MLPKEEQIGDFFHQKTLGQDATLAAKGRTLFSQELPALWCKSAQCVHTYVSVDSNLSGIEKQHLFR